MRSIWLSDGQAQRSSPRGWQAIKVLGIQAGLLFSGRQACAAAAKNRGLLTYATRRRNMTRPCCDHCRAGQKPAAAIPRRMSRQPGHAVVTVRRNAGPLASPTERSDGPPSLGRAFPSRARDPAPPTANCWITAKYRGTANGFPAPAWRNSALPPPHSWPADRPRHFILRVANEILAPKSRRGSQR